METCRADLRDLLPDPAKQDFGLTWGGLGWGLGRPMILRSATPTPALPAGGRGKNGLIER